MKIVVTGARGFVGSALVELGRVAGHRIVPVTRGRSSVDGAVEVEDYADAPAGDVLVHLAEPRDLAAAESEGATHIARVKSVARRLLTKGYGRVVYASSAVVYGDQIDTPRSPDEPLPAQAGIYASGKVQVEREFLGHAGGVIARLANVYGIGMATNNVLGDILRQVPGEGPVFVRDASPVRDFISVADAASGFLALAIGRPVGILNLGSGIGRSVAELVEVACVAAGQPLRPVYSTAPSGRRSTLVLDIARTREQFGWTPVVDLTTDIRSLLTYGR